MGILVKNYYKVLQVDPEAEAEVIEAAYRRLARKYHPDVNTVPGMTQRMQELNEAYTVLRDPSRREQYHRAFQGAHAAPTSLTPRRQPPPPRPAPTAPTPPPARPTAAGGATQAVPKAPAAESESPVDWGIVAILVLTTLLLCPPFFFFFIAMALGR